MGPRISARGNMPTWASSSATKKRKLGPTVEEIPFDPSAREEYLTGFHKRKQARIKQAQEQSAKLEREEHLRLRREARQKRKDDLEKHVAEVNTLIKKAKRDLGDPVSSSEDEEEEEWEGFDAPEAENVNREEEYIDEDKYTTVTIETVGISKDGVERVGNGESSDDGEHEKSKEKVDGEGADGKKKRVWTKEKPKSDRPKKKKQKFRYESKAERKMTRMKQGAKRKAAAEARKGK